MIPKTWYHLTLIAIPPTISSGAGFKSKPSPSKTSFIIFNILFKTFRILPIPFPTSYWLTSRGGHRLDLFPHRNLTHKRLLGHTVCGGSPISIAISWRRKEGENDYRYRDLLYILLVCNRILVLYPITCFKLNCNSIPCCHSSQYIFKCYWIT